MTAARKIDSNVAGLSYAEEESVGTLPNTPVWKPLEPNSYKDFGGEIITKARNPINSGRQRRKGVTVDLNASGGFNMDLTQTNLADLMQGFFFADLRTKAEKSVAVVDSSHRYTVTGGTAYEASDLIFAKEFSVAANNGLKLVSARSSTLVTVTDTGVTTETGASGIISRVGYQFASGLASIDADGGIGGYPRLNVSNTVAAQTFTVGGGGSVIQDGDTLVIDGRTYTWQTSLTNIDGHVLIGANDTAALLNMKKAINLEVTAGTNYALATTANTSVLALSSNATTLVINALVTGAVGNNITTTESSAGSWGSTTLTSGAGRDCRTLGLLPGEAAFLGGDQTAEQFATAADQGFVRVRSTAAGYIEFDKTEQAFADDNGATKTIRIYFGRVLKNESERALQVFRTYQLERTLGKAASGDAYDQTEYLTGSCPNELGVDFKTADILSMDLSFMSTDHETRSGTTGPKSGTRDDLVESDGFNATGDVKRIALTTVSSTNSSPTPLVGFLQDLKLMVNNNVKQNKAISQLGAFDNTAGTFEVEASITAYFTDIATVAAVRSNEDVSLDFVIVKDNAGISWDMPLLAMGDGRADVKQDTAIMIPLKTPAATGKKLDSNLDHTLFMVFFDYLPDLAA